MQPFEPTPPPNPVPPPSTFGQPPAGGPIEARAPELDVGDLVRTTFRILGNNALLFFGVMFLFQLLPLAMSIGASVKMNRAMQSLENSPVPDGADFSAVMTQVLGPMMRALPYVGISILASMILLPLAYTFILRGSLDALQDREFTIASGIQAMASRGWLLIVAQFLVGLVVGAGTLVGLFLCILPGLVAAVFLGLAFVCVLPAILAEDSNPVEGMRRSWDLTNGHKVPIFLLFLLLFAIYMVLSCGTSMVSGVLGAAAAVTDPANAQRLIADPTSPVQLVAQFLGGLVQVFWQTTMQVASAVVYARLVGLRGEIDAGQVAKVFS